MERHLLYALVYDYGAEVPGAEETLLRRDDHFAAAAEHIASHIVQERPCNAAGTAYYYIVSGVDAVAAGAVRAEQVVPAVAVNHFGGLAVYGDVSGLIAGHASSGGRIQLYYADVAEIRAVSAVQAALRGHYKADVDGIAVFVRLGMGHLYGLGVSKVGGVGVEGLVPHGHHAAVVVAAEAAAAGGVANQVAVSYLDDVGCSTAARTHAAAVPDPSVGGNEASGACAEGVVPAVTLHDCRRIVDIGLADLRRGIYDGHDSYGCDKEYLFHSLFCAEGYVSDGGAVAVYKADAEVAHPGAVDYGAPQDVAAFMEGEGLGSAVVHYHTAVA